MKEYEVAVDGRAHTIQIGQIKVGTPVGVIVDGKKVDATIQQVEESPNRFILKVAEVNFNAEIERGPELAPNIVRINGKPFVASVREAILGPAPGTLRPAPGATATPRAEISANLIAAPMPGRVISLLVKTGDRVRVGQPVLLLEAMKMENEIVAHRAGTIKSVKVAEGSTVKKDDPLVEIA